MKKYRHYKGGIYNALENTAKHSETGERLVIYIDDENGKVWARPFDMFHGYLEDGTKRFTEIDPYAEMD